MDLQQYVQNAVRTESKISLAKVDDRITFYSALTAFVAASDLLDFYKKNIYYDKYIDPHKWHNTLTALEDAVQQIRNDHAAGPGVNERNEVLHVDTRLLHAIIGIATESGELVTALLSHLNHIAPLDYVNVQEELGDLNWYHAIAVDAMRANWGTIQVTNIKKLRKRFPDKYNNDEAINRDLIAERQILEVGSSLPASLDPNSPEYISGDARIRAEEDYPFGSSDYDHVYGGPSND